MRVKSDPRITILKLCVYQRQTGLGESQFRFAWVA